MARQAEARIGPGESAAEEAAEALAPEVGLLPKQDPAALGRSLARALVRGARRPRTVGSASTRYLARLSGSAVVSAVRSFGADVSPPLSPDPDDKRFNDPAWRRNAWFTWRQQRYLAAADLIRDLVEGAELDGVEADKARFGAQMLIDAMAPTNTLWGNPTALKALFDTGGLSIARGLANFLDDLLHNRGMPRQVNREDFTVGDDLAATPGKVVFRNELMELIQYSPQTEQVHEIPLLISPPWINKYYIVDLAPGRSLVEWAVRQGHTVFVISYRNPDQRMGGVAMDDYLLEGPRAAIDVITEITGAEKVNLIGVCLGGTLTIALASYLAAHQNERVHAITLLNTLVDYGEPGPLGVFIDEQTVANLEHRMAERGYLEAKEMSTAFDVLRANDLIWSYVANNWLMGQDPPPFDLLAWNADSTRMPARMHAFFLRSCYLRNDLARGEMELAGERLHLDTITADTFIVATVNDHITPWRSSYKTTGLLPKGDVQFVLSSSGHIAGIVNPPSAKARYWTNPATPPDPDEWLEDATEHVGSWWESWTPWITARAGGLVTPPPLGSEAHPPLEDAPGRYVRERA